MPLQALAAVATLLSFSQHGNRVEFQADRGAAEMVWLSPGTFRFRRALEGALPPAETPAPEGVVHIQIDETPGAVRIRSEKIAVTVQKRGLLVAVRNLEGASLMEDLSEPEAHDGVVTWERRMDASARYYGLGPRAAEDYDLRGQSIASEFPLLLSTSGYGEFHAGRGPFRFDFTAPGSYRIQAPRVDYYVYFGPRLKAIFEEHKKAAGFAALWQPAPTPPRDALLNLTQAALSAILNPGFDLSAYDHAPAGERRRARQVFSLVPHARPGVEGLSGFRQQLATFFAAYDPEVDYKGYPVWHALPFQFPGDPECALHADEFMLGDEMLIAPILEGTSRSVYLPQGAWTNLETNAVLQGRRTVTVETPALPVFARNGAIVPLDSPGGMALHYFPELAAEFFIVEPTANDYSQVHAAPAGDEMRLEIESKVARDYQWVVHHVERPAAVGLAQTRYRPAPSADRMSEGSYFYDAAQKNLHVRVHVKAGEDCIVNLSF